MDDCMAFPDTVEEFMEQYKVVDTEQVYTNGMEMVPIFRMRQWFEHLPERKAGKWLDGPEGEPVAFDKDEEGYVPVGSCWCSECGEWLVGSDEYPVNGHYCPNCGADMRGGQNG